MRQIARIVGSLSSTCLAVLPAPLHYRGLQSLKIRGLLPHLSYELIVPESDGPGMVDKPPRRTQWKGDSPMPSQDDNRVRCIQIRVGSMLQGPENRRPVESTGVTTPHQCQGVVSCLPGSSNICKEQGRYTYSFDNTTAVYYINGTHSRKLMELTSQMWEWSLERKIFLLAEHLPGKLNIIADRESRMMGDSSEGNLDPAVFHQIMKVIGPCEVDLFASRLSMQLPRYMSWKPDPGSIATAALSQPWREIRGYAFPPFSLIGRCLSKIRREEVPFLILVAPVWPTQPWFAVLQSMLCQRPILLPRHLALLRNHSNKPHPLIHQLHVACVRSSLHDRGILGEATTQSSW